MRSLLRPKRAIVLRCRNCQFELSLKSKGPYTDNRCPCCETISLFVPDDIPAIKLEQLYRFIDDDEKLELLDEEHDELTAVVHALLVIIALMMMITDFNTGFQMKQGRD